jgi:hypothetical protein
VTAAAPGIHLKMECQVIVPSGVTNNLLNEKLFFVAASNKMTL